MTTSKREKKYLDLESKLNDVFSAEDEAENFIFEKMVINSKLVDVIKALMKLHGIKTKKELANKLNVKAPYITNLFISNKFINIELLVKLQRVFNTTFEFSAKSLTKKVSTSDKVEITVGESDLAFFKGEIKKQKLDSNIFLIPKSINIASSKKSTTSEKQTVNSLI